MRKALLPAVALVCVGCVASLTTGGQAVRLVNDSKPCELITVVMTRASNGGTRSQKTENAITKAKNRAAELGGNAIRLGEVDPGPVATNVTAEVLKCDFRKLQ